MKKIYVKIAPLNVKHVKIFKNVLLVLKIEKEIHVNHYLTIMKQELQYQEDVIIVVKPVMVIH